MDAVKFLKEKERMCCHYNDCDMCPASKCQNKYKLHCEALEDEHPDELVSIVEKWSKEHGKKTRQSEVLKMFPDAVINKNGTVDINPCRVEKNRKDICDRFKTCDECKEEYWLAEVEDEGEKER